MCVANEENPDAKDCHICGKPFFIDKITGIANHIKEDEPDEIDHNEDADHVPYAIENQAGP